VANVAAPVKVPVHEPAKGTRPEGAENEADASRKVREMFTQIAPSYDFLNHLLSLGIDRLWRRRVARQLRPILQRPDALVLDLCCGTGDMALSLTREGKVRVFGADFAHPMLLHAKEKSAPLAGSAAEATRKTLPVLEADALRLPFADYSFDLLTTAFGFRNLANYEAGLHEVHRVLKPGGTIAILEFTEPPDDFVGNVFRWYYRNVLPRIGGLISGDSSAYTYLPNSVTRFFRPPELATLMAGAGYESVEFKVWTFGTVALHTGVRPLR
jgi:demethylmenaquinone methyltransferase/2-methoxy-6-polyprenyl-1,4-benzoquinol methylase